MRIRYRTSQFWKALSARPSRGQLALAQQTLIPELMTLFQKMQPSEQFHSLTIFERLIAEGEHDSDLLTAALLHDVGKTRSPLRIWERVLIVIARRLFPSQVVEWGKGQPRGWKRPFVVAEQHATWGAEMVAAAGASNVTVGIIRCHHKPQYSFSVPGTNHCPEEIMLFQLQALDQES